MKQILIVEDEYMIALVLEKQIRHNGWEVLAVVDNGKEAISMVREHRPDVVLMDITLRGEMDGTEAMKEIRSFSDVPVIYLTGNAESHAIVKTKGTRPTAILIKPVASDDLLETIRKVT
ncbi:MAG: response regulator [Cyclonatronaceae bacterium]